MSGILEKFTKSLTGKSAEIEQLKQENRILRQSLEEKSSMAPGQTLSYAKIAKEPNEKPQRAATQMIVTQTKTAGTAPTSKATKRKALNKCREAKASTRFIVDVPTNMTVAQVKTDLWKAVQQKLPNPRAKTVVQGNAIIVMPDDQKTLEVLKRVPNLRSVGPRQPRII